MTICKHQHTKTFGIFSPRWNDRKVLLKDVRLGTHNRIFFTGKDGASMGKDPYYISGRRAKQFGTEMMKTKEGGEVRMRVIPIDELQTLEYKEHCEHEIF